MIFLKYFSQIKVHQVFLLFFPLAVAFGGTVNPVYAGPKKVTQFSFDRFIPERLTDPVDISLRQARLLGVFDHQSEDLADYIYRDAISQGLYGVSLEEGRRGGYSTNRAVVKGRQGIRVKLPEFYSKEIIKYTRV